MYQTYQDERGHWWVAYDDGDNLNLIEGPFKSQNAAEDRIPSPNALVSR